MMMMITTVSHGLQLKHSRHTPLHAATPPN
jgi:hypothetical protein